MLKIGILGTRGIPNFYGGFEQCAQYVAQGLAQRNHDVTVYNSSDHPYKKNIWQGVKIVHATDLEKKWGAAGQFVYDLNCILHARKQQYDVILQLGYTSNSVWGWLLPSHSIITTNMDGLEWKRSKYSKPVQIFLKQAEKLAIRFSDFLIADSVGIQDYLKKEYKVVSTYIPYGAHVLETYDVTTLKNFAVEPYMYNMLIARLEPENNIEVILDAIVESSRREPFLVIGKYKTSYGNCILEKYKEYDNIKFLGAIYDIKLLNNLRYFSNLYFHGHSVGGTNPSLLEAMASGALICAHRNVFNNAILQSDAFYFSSSDEVKHYVETINKKDFSTLVATNIEKIKNVYSWDKIINDYELHFKNIARSSPTH